MADQAVAVVYLGEQGHSSILEAVVHPDLPTVVQQHIVGDVVSSGRENGKRSWKPRISESMTLNDVHVQALLYCANPLYLVKALTAQSHYSFKKRSQCT